MPQVTWRAGCLSGVIDFMGRLDDQARCHVCVH